MVALDVEGQAALERLKAIDDLEIVIETDDAVMQRKFGLEPGQVSARIEALFGDLDYDMANATDGASIGFNILCRNGEDDEWGGETNDVGRDVATVLRAALAAKLPG